MEACSEIFTLEITGSMFFWPNMNINTPSLLGILDIVLVSAEYTWKVGNGQTPGENVQL